MKRSVIVGLSVTAVILLSGLGVGLYFIFSSGDILSGNVFKGAVATSTIECTDAAVMILQKGGSAADSAVTAALCQGLTVPQSSGLGGGFLATIYIKESGKVETINSREVAPLSAHKDMFVDEISSEEGGLAVAVPGELKGLYELQRKYGKLSWAEVVQPVIDIAEKGYKVTGYLASIFEERGDKLRTKPGFREFFVNPNTGNFYKEGDILTNPKLAATFKAIAEEGSDAIYGGGSLAQGLVDEIRAAGGIITMEDLKAFQPKWGTSKTNKLFNGEILHSSPLPSSGNIINFIFNVLNGYGFEKNTYEHHLQDKLIFHRMIEAFKFAFAKRSFLGDDLTSLYVQNTLKQIDDPEYAEAIRKSINDDLTNSDYEHYGANMSVVEDHGTSHLSILAPNGDAVALTSTINLIMGAYVMSESTGIIFNSEMNDFSIPVAESDGLLPAPANFIAPQKSPMSSMSPIIILNEQKDVSVVLGGAGGILIMTSIVQFIINYIFLNRSIEDSLAVKRLHHQLKPMYVRYEEGHEPEILKFLESKGHETYESPPIISGFASVIAIARRNGKIEAAIDPRRGGKVTIF